MINVKKIFGTTKSKPAIEWSVIDSEITLNQAINKSSEHPVVIFKHSTRCSISSMALSRLEREWDTEEMNSITPYYLDLISYRSISNLIAEKFGVRHESPQVLVIKNGESVYHSSHMGISYDEIKNKTA